MRSDPGDSSEKVLETARRSLGMIPEAQNDMILSVICEELGVFGAIVVLVLFGLLLIQTDVYCKKCAGSVRLTDRDRDFCTYRAAGDLKYAWL